MSVLMKSFFALSNATWLACSVCFGNPDSASSKAVGAAVLFLLGVVAFVLVAIAWTAFSWYRRARLIPPDREISSPTPFPPS